MKIYVSNKEQCFKLMKKLKPIGSGYIAVITPLDGTDASIFIKEVKSLEQHEAEIRKPLEEEIASLNRFISQLLYWKDYWYNSYDKLRNKYNKINKSNKECQRVIAELEEWVEEVTELGDIGYFDMVNIILKDELKQKLNEMKGEK